MVCKTNFKYFLAWNFLFLKKLKKICHYIRKATRNIVIFYLCYNNYWIMFSSNICVRNYIKLFSKNRPRFGDLHEPTGRQINHIIFNKLIRMQWKCIRIRFAAFVYLKSSTIKHNMEIMRHWEHEKYKLHGYDFHNFINFMLLCGLFIY